MARECFFVKSQCFMDETCEFWDENRSNCNLKQKVNVETAHNDKKQLNASTFIKIADANPSRNGLIICSTDEQDIYISLSTVANAVDSTGYYLKGFIVWEIPGNYVGEVCGKAVANSPTISYIEY